MQKGRLGKRIVTTAIEHESVLQSAQQLEKQGFYVEVSGYASMDYTFRAKNPSITTTYTTTTDPNMTTDESFTESTTATTATKKIGKLLRYKQLLPLKWITTDIPAQPEPADLG